MSFIETVKDALTEQPAAKSQPDDGSKGAYWCDDCNNRIRDINLEGEPVCPDCGEEMRFERATGRDCAC
jgi:predicted amidophosphoribosyltransferase